MGDVNFFHQIEAEVGPTEVLVFNACGNVRFPILETTAQKYFKVEKYARWRALWRTARVVKPALPQCHEVVALVRDTAG